MWNAIFIALGKRTKSRSKVFQNNLGRNRSNFILELQKCYFRIKTFLCLILTSYFYLCYLCQHALCRWYRAFRPALWQVSVISGIDDSLLIFESS